MTNSRICIVLIFVGLTIMSSCANQNKPTNDLSYLPTESRSTQQTNTDTSYSYDFSKPSGTWHLPKELKEISGIGMLNSGRIIALEDQHPLLYEVSLHDNGEGIIEKTFSILQTDKSKFDMEDLTVVNDTVYALWSHGTIFKIPDWKNNGKSEEIDTYLDKKNNTEGLALDPVTGNLLIACKESSGIEDEKKSSRAIYVFNTQTKKIEEKPFLIIEKKELKKQAGEKVDFYPSAVAVHPFSHDVFVISTRGDKCLAVFSYAGTLKSFYFLDKDLMPQPEGICFDKLGNLYISTEGIKDPPAIFKFDMKTI